MAMRRPVSIGCESSGGGVSAMESTWTSPLLETQLDAERGSPFRQVVKSSRMY